jgi:hypothetical protein
MTAANRSIPGPSRCGLSGNFLPPILHVWQRCGVLMSNDCPCTTPPDAILGLRYHLTSVSLVAKCCVCSFQILPCQFALRSFEDLLIDLENFICEEHNHLLLHLSIITQAQAPARTRNLGLP